MIFDEPGLLENPYPHYRKWRAGRPILKSSYGCSAYALSLPQFRGTNDKLPLK